MKRIIAITLFIFVLLVIGLNFELINIATSLVWSDNEVLEHEKGFIYDPVGKAKSVVFTKEGLEQSNALFKELFDEKLVRDT